MSKRRIPSVFFLKFFFFKLFIWIFTFKMYSFLYAISNGFQTKIFQVFTFLKILTHSPAQELSNTKIQKIAAFCVFCGLRHSSDNLLSFDTNALYFVRPLCLLIALKVCNSEANAFCFLSSLPLLPSASTRQCLGPSRARICKPLKEPRNRIPA